MIGQEQTRATIAATEAALLSLSNRLDYAGPAVWIGIGIAILGFAENQGMGVGCGAMLAIFAFCWKSDLKQEYDRLSASREALMAAANGDPGQ